MKARGKREIPEKTHRTATTSGTIPTCENPGVTRPGTEPETRKICEVNDLQARLYSLMYELADKLRSGCLLSRWKATIEPAFSRSHIACRWVGNYRLLKGALPRVIDPGCCDERRKTRIACISVSLQLRRPTYLLVQGQEARERYGRHSHARLAPHRSYAQGVQCFRPDAVLCQLNLTCSRLDFGRCHTRRLGRGDPCKHANMSSPDEDVVSGYMYLHSRNKKRKRFWVHPDFEKQHEKRWYKIARESENPTKFKQTYKVSRESFCVPEGHDGPLISKKNANYRDAVGISERLLITIKYLVTGSEYADLASYFLRGDSTTSHIVPETTAAIWKALHPLYEIWNLPNCVGAIDDIHNTCGFDCFIRSNNYRTLKDRMLKNFHNNQSIHHRQLRPQLQNRQYPPGVKD
ncbi:hypothetical protein PR048_025767 [Dryococelus australis]|uniref:Uncharacterized protein n=1 Tax=Dryococelus australis TaxID=614101 RepID=A0ABQ9GJG8_9NEOP|nr:hypothetical protein PR048_025767 [Dryococelus australis]